MGLYNKNDMTENKLILLYAVVASGSGISELDLVDMVVGNDWMYYFDAMQLLYELCGSGLLTRSAVPSGYEYSFTSEGAIVVDEFASRIPYSLRLALDDEIRDLRRPAEQRNRVKASFRYHGENNFVCRLSLHEGDQVLFQMNVTASSEEAARSLCERFKQTADSIYSQSVHMLLFQQ